MEFEIVNVMSATSHGFQYPSRDKSFSGGCGLISMILSMLFSPAVAVDFFEVGPAKFSA